MESYYLFSLPPELLDSLVLREIGRNLIETQIDASQESQDAVVIQTEKSGTSCLTCPNANHATLDEQRAHFRTDWHRYNIKLKLSQNPVVTETEFDSLVDALEGSISGSDSSSEDGEEVGISKDSLSKLLNRLNYASDDEEAVTKIPRSPIVWFHSPPSTQLGFYSAVFPEFAENLESGSYRHGLALLQTLQPKGRVWILLMVAAGHFAGLVVEVSPPISDAPSSAPIPLKKQVGKKGNKPPQHPSPPPFNVLRHKTFHRYTTRRKQGGGQSANDNAKGAAHSAGATLRRYGEQALQDDIRELLADWAEEIQNCEKIWMRASGKTRKIFWDYNDALISKNDNRLRNFPFPTRRPTHKETIRCLNELTRPKVTHLEEAELNARDEAILASLPKSKPKMKPIIHTHVEKVERGLESVKLSQEQERVAEAWHKILEMIRKGRLAALQQFWEREAASIGGVDAIIPNWIDEKRQLTLLQVASLSGQAEIVQWLLEGARANPCILVSERDTRKDRSDATDDTGTGPRQTAYELAATREVRNVFRRCAGIHPDWWDWFGEGHVPATLTQEMEDKRDEKKRQRRVALKDKIRERMQDKPPEPEIPSSPLVRFMVPTSGPQRLGGRSGSQDTVDGLTTEMRLKIERERRARAAEARSKH